MTADTSLTATKVTQLFSEAQPGPAVEDMGPTLLEMAQAIASLCATRVLGLIAVVGAVAIFTYAVIDPAPWRTITAGAYAITVLLPLVYLYLRKG